MNTQTILVKVQLTMNAANKLRIKKRSTVILGDSKIKDVERYLIRKDLNNKEKVFVKHFSGATVEDMKNYKIPSKKHENDLVILHVGTNDLRDPKSAIVIATKIIVLVMDMKTQNNDIMISGIAPRSK